MSLAMRGVSAGYGDTVVVRELSLDVPDGTVVALLGRNGAGKSTTLKTIIGLIRARSGEIGLLRSRLKL